MGIWAQIGDDDAFGIVPDGKTVITILAEFSFSGKAVPEGAVVNFLVGSGQLPPVAESSGGNPVRKQWTLAEVVGCITPIDGVTLSSYQVPVKNRVVRSANGTLSVKAVAATTLQPISNMLLDKVTIVAYCQYNKVGTVARLEPQQLPLPNQMQSIQAGVYLAAVERYDPGADAWTRVADMNVGRAGPFCGTLTVLGNPKLFVAGGFDGNFVGTCEEYDPVADEWTQKADMPEPRGYGMSVVYGNKLWCIGGYSLAYGRASDKLHAYDPGTDTWEEKASLPYPVAYGTAQVIGTKAYVLYGGIKFTQEADSPEVVNAFNAGVLSYDFGSDAWTQEDVVTSPTVMLLQAGAAAGATSLAMAQNLTIPPYGFLALDRGGAREEIVRYVSYASRDGTVVLGQALAMAHPTGEQVRMAGLPDNRLGPCSVVTGSVIRTIDGLSTSAYTSQGASAASSTTVDYDSSSKAVTSYPVGPALPLYRPGSCAIGLMLYSYGGSSANSEWENKTETLDASTNPGTFVGPAGLAKMEVARLSPGAAALSGLAYAVGGGGSGHPPGWLRISVAADPTSIPADGKATSSIVITATDASGDPPDDGTSFRLSGIIFEPAEQDQRDEAAIAASSGASGTSQAVALPALQKVSILPVLFSARDVTTVDGEASTVLLERSEDPIRELANLSAYVKGNEELPNQEALKGQQAQDQAAYTSMTLGETRPLYQAAIQATVLGTKYVGTSDTDAAVTGQSPAALGGRRFAFSPPPAEQGLSASVEFFSPGVSVPDIVFEAEEASATDAKAALEKARQEIPFGASPLYDAMMLGAEKRSIVQPVPPPTNIMVAASDNDESFSSSTPTDVVDEANGVAGAYKFPVFSTTFVITDPVSLSARRSRTDVAALERISYDTGGSSFSVIDASYIPFVINRIKTSAPSSIGSGTVTVTHSFDGWLSAISYAVSNLSLAGNSAEARIWTSMDGYNFEDLGVTVPPNVAYTLGTPTRAKQVRYQVTLSSQAFDSPILSRVDLNFIEANVQFLFTYPKEINGQVAEMAGVTNVRLPSGGTAEMGLYHGSSVMFDRDYAWATQPSIKDRGAIVAVNRSFDSYISSTESTQDVLVTDDFLVYSSKTGPWSQEADVAVTVNGLLAAPEDYVAAPERGMLAFRKKLAATDVVALEVTNPPTFTVGVKVTNPALSKGLLDSLAYGWTTTEDNAGIRANRPPRAVNPFVSPSPALPGGPLTANYTFVDPDGDEEDKDKTQITWYRNGAPVPELANKRTITNSDILARRADASADNLITKGQQWFFAVRPSDGLAFGPLATSGKVTIANVPPAAEGVKLTSSNADPTVFTSSDSISVDFAFVDADGDQSSGSVYVWFANGLEVKSGDENTLGPQEKDSSGNKILAPGTSVRCDVTPSDGTDFGATVSSNTISVAGSPPSVKDVAILPAAPSALSNLRVKYTFVDVDSLPDQSRIAWFKNGSRSSELDNSQTVSALLLAPAQQWYVVVTPYNGTAQGTSVQSNTVVIQF